MQSNDDAAWEPHPVLAGISSDDPELQDILRGINKPVFSVNDVVAAGPFKRVTVYDHSKPFEIGDRQASTGLLKTWVSAGRRFTFALDYAKYLLALKRIGGSRAQQGNLPRNNRRSRYAASAAA